MANKLAGQTILITGAGRGFGEEIAGAVAREGASAMVADLDLDQAERVAAGLRQEGLAAQAFQADVTDEPRVTRMVGRILAQFGRIDVLVNNAGIPGPMGELYTLDAQEWDNVFAVNVRGVFLCCKAVIPHMMQRGSGHIVNISSDTTAKDFKIEWLRSFPYSVSKATVNAISHFLSLQLSKHNIRVNTLCPGLADTHFQANTPASYLRGRRCWKASHTAGPLLFVLAELQGTGHTVLAPAWHQERGTVDQFSYVHD